MITEELKNFLTDIAESISNTIYPTNLEPDDFVPSNPNPPILMYVGLTSLQPLAKSFVNFASKTRVDVNGLGTTHTS